MNVAWLERKALDYVARWESTRRGITEFLERRILRSCEQTGERPESMLALVPEVVDRLAARDYVNDQRAADQLFDRLRREGRSRVGIQRRLDRRGVPRSIVDALLADDDPDADLCAAGRWAKRHGLGPFCSDPARRMSDRQRHLGVLARQGFSSEVAHRVIDASDAADDSESTSVSEHP